MVEINNLTTIRTEQGFLKKVAEKVLKGENRSRINLSVALVGQGRIKELNRKYRRKNRVTDVLSFSYDDSGEIAICLPQVKKNAKRFNSTFEKELARVLIHGTLHLLGYDHEAAKPEAKKMEQKQEKYLKLFFK
jgi:probable rRNA maturation factor